MLFGAVYFFDCWFLTSDLSCRSLDWQILTIQLVPEHDGAHLLFELEQNLLGLIAAEAWLRLGLRLTRGVGADGRREALAQEVHDVDRFVSGTALVVAIVLVVPRELSHKQIPLSGDAQLTEIDDRRSKLRLQRRFSLQSQ